MGLWWRETLCVFHTTTTPFFLYAHVWCVVLCACSACACVCIASVCVCVGCVLIKGVRPLFFMPTLRGAGGCLWCSRIRDYVNPWSGLRCGCGGAGVFVITDSWSWFRAEGCENTPTTTPRPETHLGACSISSCSRIRDYVNPWSGLRCGCGGAGVFVVMVSWSWFRGHGFVVMVSWSWFRAEECENTPVRGSINSIFDYSGPVLGVDRRYWFWNPAVLSACDNKSWLPWSIHCW
ncbi:hypothetical protein CIP107521_02140 [Corynebacterium diphtheriae]|nr:hypothetical protein CIP107521_02140 [Corynebacterium diphtheriae]